ncbi:MAG: hypothetical protein HRT77_07385 [Halioglobus sp.]|nr:hypothetical protein [Halioglobus sp.]
MLKVNLMHWPATALLAPVLILAACSDSNDGSGPGTVAVASCGEVTARSLQVCLGEVNAAQRGCYIDGDAPCENDDGGILAAKDRLEESVRAACTGAEFLNLSEDALVGRMQNACRAQSDALTWRTFGGPLGVVWASADNGGRTCLEKAHETGSTFLDEALQSVNSCLSGEVCEPTVVRAAQEEAAAAAVGSIAAACPDLEPMISVSPKVYMQRAQEQLDCLMSSAHEDASRLEPQCGPSNVDIMPQRGEWTQIVLDGEQWGTMCGDGGPYAIQIRLAPEGSPVDRIILALEGGGVCLFESDCTPRFESSPQLFSALDNGAPSFAGGIAGDSADNPFRDWTFVYLPYCNQDVFIGGGAVETLGNLDLPRYGAINLRAGVRVTRDILWKYMDENSEAGFRPDQLIALFGGFSAGGYGTLFNYHWMLDDLQWPRTAAFPDAGGALDNGTVTSISSLPPLKIPAWGTQPYLPPYCVNGECIIGPENYRIMSPRLKAVPEQQYLILSNQLDDTQGQDSFFTDSPTFVNAIRSAYCETKDLRGIQWYLTSQSDASQHVVSIFDEFYYGDVAGERMVDWFWRAVTDPDSVTDWAEEGNFITDVPGVEPFSCGLP